MQIPGTRAQQTLDFMFDASGVLTAGATPQLLLPQAKSRSYLYIANLSTTENLYVDHGSARATCTISSGVVNAVTVTNGGINFTYPPIVQFLGGGNSGQGSWLGVGQIGYPAPGDPAYAPATYSDMSKQRPAHAHAVLTGASVTSIVIDDGGAGYQAAPYVFLSNDPKDPLGVVDPSKNSGAGFWGTFLLPPVTSTTLFPGLRSWLEWNGTACPTDAFSIYATTISHPFSCKYMP